MLFTTLYSLLEIITVLLPVLLIVAFITIIERTSMGSMQRRIGPNSVGYYGLLQPIADALKLLVKEIVIPSRSNKVLFFLAPIFSMTFAVLGWAVVPFSAGLSLFDWSLGILYSLALSSLGVYGILFAGWSANTKWAFLGALRSTAQIISYELLLSSGVLAVLLLSGTYNLTNIIESQSAIWYIFPLFPILVLFFISVLAELGRTPIDLVEAESELVSGFITEHSSVIFVFFFLAEYCSLVLISTFTTILFLGGYKGMIDGYATLDAIILGLKSVFIIFVFVWIRATLPRIRYDQLIVVCWTQILPIIFALLTMVPCILISFDIIPLFSPLYIHLYLSICHISKR